MKAESKAPRLVSKRGKTNDSRSVRESVEKVKAADPYVSRFESAFAILFRNLRELLR
jgi:hypothetical protein